MSKKCIEFEAKIKVKEKVDAKTLLQLLKYISEDLGFSIKKLESDEITMIKPGKALQPKSSKKEPSTADITDNKYYEDAAVEIEIEVSTDELEIEIESEDIETVKDLASKIAGML